jgi:hypothetical protein
MQFAAVPYMAMQHGFNAQARLAEDAAIVYQEGNDNGDVFLRQTSAGSSPGGILSTSSCTQAFFQRQLSGGSQVTFVPVVPIQQIDPSQIGHMSSLYASRDKTAIIDESEELPKNSSSNMSQLVRRASGSMVFDKREKHEDYWLRRVITSNNFDLICATIILSNAFTIGYSAEEAIVWALDNPGEPQQVSNEVIYYLNRFYITFYIAELFSKLWVWRLSFFTGDNARWNMFDLILVLTGIHELVSEMTPMDLGDGAGVTWLRVLRIVKSLKLLRVIRVMRFFQTLRTMVSSIMGSMHTLLWSILMISIIMYMFGLCFLQAATIYLNEHKVSDDAPEQYNLPDVDPDVFDGIVLYWSSVQQSMMTLFWSVTGGADWEPLAMPIRKADPFFYGLYFFYIAFAALAVLNVLTGMFVDTAMKVAQQDEQDVEEELWDRQEIKNYRQFALETLTDTPGYITWEFVDAHGGEDERVHHFIKLLEIESEDCRRVFRTMDTEKKGMVDLEEFIKGCFHARGSVNGLDMIFLMSETKSLSKHMQISMNYVEDRFNEILSLCAPGCLSSVATWEQRLDSAGRTDGQRLNSV